MLGEVGANSRLMSRTCNTSFTCTNLIIKVKYTQATAHTFKVAAAPNITHRNCNRAAIWQHILDGFIFYEVTLNSV